MRIDKQNSAVLADRIDLLAEIADIEEKLARLAQTHGPHPLIVEEQLRARRMRVDVLARLNAGAATQPAVKVCD